MGVAWMILELNRAYLKISKQTFGKRISEHLTSGGNVLLDTVNLIILQKFY